MPAKKLYQKILWACAGAMLLTLTGCRSLPERVYYYGPGFKAVRSAEVIKAAPDALRKAGYEQIGTIRSEPMTQSARFDQDMDQQALIDAIAPENSNALIQYYARLDEQACRLAARMGGSFIRLEEIRHTFPKLTPESAILLGTDFGKDVKHVTSVKIWSVWRALEPKK